MKTTTTTTTKTAATVKHEKQVTRPSSSIKAAYQAENANNKAVIVKGAFGNYAESLAKGETTYSKSALVETCNVAAEVVENLYNDCATLMGKIGVMMDARESAKGNPKKGSQAATMVENAEKSVKKLAESLFYAMAYRKGKAHKDKRGEWVTPKEPFYKVRYADFAIFGEMLEQSKQGADSNRIERFMGLFLLFGGRILTGKPAGRVTASDLKEARKAAKEAAAKKREKTNATKKTEKPAKEEKEPVSADKTAAITTASADLLEAIRASHATDDEKKNMEALLKKLVAAAM